MRTRLALDHLTAVDATPIELVELARKMDCDAVCLFMEPMEVLRHMPSFELYRDRGYRKALKRSLADQNIAVDLVYPFTLAGHTDIPGFEPALGCAADIGARLVNVLSYDRDPSRRQDRFAEFCVLAAQNGLGVALEFYPASRIRSLNEAINLVESISPPVNVGVNVDLLHLIRSGGHIDDLSATAGERIIYAQISDGPLIVPPQTFEFEASSSRLLPGQGAFDIARFVERLPNGCPISVEIPRDEDIAAGMACDERVRRAIDLTRQAIAKSSSCRPD